MVEEPEDVHEQLVRNPSYVDRFRFFLTFEREGLWEALDDLGYDALWDRARVACLLRDMKTKQKVYNARLQRVSNMKAPISSTHKTFLGRRWFLGFVMLGISQPARRDGGVNR